MPREYPLISSFNGGEVSPLIDGRADLEKYPKLLKKCENYLLTPQGPAIFRPAFEFIAETETSANQSRLVEFRFSNEQAYVLEFGDLTVRFFRDGGLITEVDAETKLLLHADGTDGSTDFIDSSPSAHTVDEKSNAQLDTAEKKFGVSSGLFDGTNDRLEIGDDADFDLSVTDGGFDAWVRMQTGESPPYTLFHQDQTGDSQVYMKGYLSYYTGLLLNGDTLLDSSFNTKTMTNVNSVTVNTDNPKFGTGALEFNGSTNYLTHTGDSDFDIGATGSAEVFTIEMWIRPDTVAGTQTLFLLNQDSNNFLIINLATSVVTAIHKADGGTQVSIQGGTVAAETYSHIAVVGDGTNFTLYVDGVRVDTDTFNDTLNDMSADDIFIGSSSSSFTRYDGLIDDLKFSLSARYSGATLTVPTVAERKIAHAVFELGDSGPVVVDTVEMPQDDITPDKFHHIEMNYDVSEPQVYMFTDGQLHADGVQSMTLTADGGLDEDFFIGTEVDNSNDFKGWMDEIRWSKGTLRHTVDFVPLTVQYGLSPEGGGSGIEVVTPYVKGDLFQLKFAQSADVLYIAHPSYAPRKLIRLADTSWSLVEIEFLPPPLKTEREDPNIELTLGQKEVGADIAATDAGTAGTLFADGDVGKEIREDSTVGNGRAVVVAVADADTATVDIFVEFSSTTPDAGTWDFIGLTSSGTLTISGHYAGGLIVNYGEVVTLTTSLDVFAAGDIGSFIVTDDGTGAIIYKILTFTNSKVVTGVATATDTYDTNVVLLAGEWELKKSVWTTSDYPGSVVFFENRLLWAGSPSFPQTIWGSQVDDYENHDPGSANDSDAYAFTLLGRQVNTILWMEDGDSLLVGTEGGEWAFGSRGAGEPVTPTNVDAKQQTSNGSANIQPVKIGQFVLYVQKGARKVREMIFNFDVDRYKSDDLNILAEHITEGGVKELAFQNYPYSTIWMIRGDGTLLGLTLLKDENVIAWHRHTTGLSGEFESIAVIPGNNEDELWAIIKRTVDGSVVRYVEKMDSVFSDDDMVSNPIFFMDSGVKYDGVPTTTITGLDHLDGETVSVVGDGLQQDDATVSSGSITIDSASKVGVGIAYDGTLQLMRLEAGASDGTAQARDKKITLVNIRFNKAFNAKCGPSETDNDRISDDFTAGELLTADVRFDYPEGYETDGNITILQDKPFPQTIVAIIPNVDTKEGV